MCIKNRLALIVPAVGGPPGVGSVVIRLKVQFTGISDAHEPDANPHVVLCIVYGVEQVSSENISRASGERASVCVAKYKTSRAYERSSEARAGGGGREDIRIEKFRQDGFVK